MGTPSKSVVEQVGYETIKLCAVQSRCIESQHFWSGTHVYELFAQVACAGCGPRDTQKTGDTKRGTILHSTWRGGPQAAIKGRVLYPETTGSSDGSDEKIGLKCSCAIGDRHGCFACLAHAGRVFRES